jgi:hypothetical protein
MARYDRNFGNRDARPGGAPARGQGRPLGLYASGWKGYGRDFSTRPRPDRAQWDAPPDAGRGVYGGAYPGYGGWPGGPRPGGYYGGGRPSQARGAPEGGPRRWHYGDDYAREPFVPDEAYRRHPEYRQRDTRGRQFPAGPGAYADDDELGDDEVLLFVRSRLEHDSWLESGRIDVEVEDGIVTLRGEVGDFLEARYAWDDAWESPGVRGVVNHIVVRTDQPHDAHGDLLPQSAGERPTARDLEQGG